MDLNLDKIAVDLYDKLKDRFTDIKFGDQEANVLSKEEDVPEARFFEFPYKHQGVVLGTVAITLDSDDGLVTKIGGALADKKHPGVLKFLKGLRRFAKVRLLKFDLQNIGKNNLDKRDYHFHAKRKEEKPMDPIMENKLFGTARLSYQDLGEATLIIKHSQPINTELAAGRTMHIESIYVENAQGERFKYPYKHINGARALAEHIKHGGNPYDAIGQHICNLSEELAQLRKFKGYVGRNAALSEAMGDITSKVFDRIEEVKKEVNLLQRTSYYEQFAESFTDREEQMIPEAVMSDWIDRLTIRTFNEELKTAFPYIFRLVDEGEIPTKELGPDDILGEITDIHDPHSARAWHQGASDRRDGIQPNAKRAGLEKYEKEYHHGYNTYGNSTLPSAKLSINNDMEKNQDPEEQFENFMDSILEDLEDQEGTNTLFSPNLEVRGQAIKNLKKAVEQELPAGEDGLTAIESLKGIIDSQELEDRLKELASGGDSEIDARGTIKDYLIDLAKEKFDEPEAPGANEIAKQLIAQNEISFDGQGDIGGQDMDQPPADMAPLAPPPEAAVPPPDMSIPPPPEGAVPPPPEGAVPPLPGGVPVAESGLQAYLGNKKYGKDGMDQLRKAGQHHASPSAMSKLKAKLIKARERGATLETQMDFGHKVMTLHDCIEECGMDPEELGFEPKHNPMMDMWKKIEGFWDGEKFNKGGTGAKIIIMKGFNNDEFPDAEPHHVKHMIDMIEKMDPSGHDELEHVRHLSGMRHADQMAEDTQSEFDQLMKRFADQHSGEDLNQLIGKYQQTTAAPGTSQHAPAATQPFNPQDMFKGIMGQVAPQMRNQMQQAVGQAPNQDINFPGGQFNPQTMFKGLMDKIPKDFPGMNESDELNSWLKIAGVKK